jgi:D-lactate dehydrogenase (cytochrome)
MAWVPGFWNHPRRAPWGYLKTPLPKPDRGILSDSFPKQGGHQALHLKPPGEAVKTVFYFPGCGSERQFSDVSRAALYLLLKTGHQVVLPPPNLCCGFPVKANADPRHGSMVLANSILFSQIREMFRFLDFDAVALTCGTCREALLEMGSEEIFAAPLRDVWALALEAGLRMETSGVELYHRPCHDSLQNRAEILASAAGMKLRSVPHCCSEAGTLALSRPDITGAMLDKKSGALRDAIEETGARKILTNCPSCLQGLGRQEALGIRPAHLAVELAERTGGEDWKKQLAEMLKTAELVNI